MKILKKIILANLTFNLDLMRYQFNASAMPYLIMQQSTQTCETGYHGCTDLTSSTNENIDMIRSILYARNRVDKSFDQCAFRKKLDWEFRNCFGDMKRYYFDFKSYDMSKTQAFNKAITICLLRIIKKYWDDGDHPEHIYRTLILQKRHGEINCNSGSEFYDHIKWLLTKKRREATEFLDESLVYQEQYKANVKNPHQVILFQRPFKLFKYLRAPPVMLL